MDTIGKIIKTGYPEILAQTIGLVSLAITKATL
jgi:hypothetical protein